MKKRLALATAFAFSIIPFTSFADHLEPVESEIKKGGELGRTKLEDYDLSSNNLSDDTLIAFEGIEGCDYSMNGYCIEPGANLSGANLSETDLSGANLSETDLSGANLSGANLSETDLSGANLSGTNLSNANLFNANLFNANLSNANLSNANLQDADLIFINAANVDLSNTDLSNARLDIADLSVANLSGANLSGADLIRADLNGANLSNANLFDTDLFDANLSDANLTDVIAENLNGCPSLLPEGWLCEDNSLKEEVEETSEAEDIDFDSITVESLPYSVDCPPKNKDLKIKQNKKEKFVVRFASGKRFYKGLDFDEAVDVFEEIYEDKCV